MGRPAGSGRRAPLPVVPKPSNMRHLLILLASSATGQVVIHNRLAGGPGHLSLGGPPPPQDPCFPNPCGPGALCHPNPQGNAICTCQPGLIPKPDTITGCGPECVRDPDCQRGLVCQDQRCVVKPDPCLPSPCGPGAVCSVTGSGNAICRCEPGLIPNPDTISGCKPECVRDPDCQSGYICQNQKRVEKPDPCDPSPCGPGAVCTINFGGNPICRCEPGLIPKPDTISGCGPECVRDPDCQSGYICQSQRCVVKPDPCDPSPCGPNTECSVTPNGNPICRCLPNYIPQPDTITGCGRECERDPDCSSGNICQNYQCVPRPDPCDPTPCGRNTQCNVNRQGNPVCTCNDGFEPAPDTITGCSRIVVRTPPPDPCDPSPCGPNTRCDVNFGGNPVCKCLSGYVPNPDTISGCKEKPDPCNPSPCGTNAECIPNGDNANCKCPPGHQGDPFVFCKKGECEYDHDCSSQLACFDFKCRDPCIGTCGQLAECQVRDHRPICSCPQGYTGDPLTACKRRTVVGAKQSRPKSEPRSVIVIGQQYSADGSSREVQQTIARGGGGRSFNRGNSRSVAVIGASAKKRRFLRLTNSFTRDE